MGKGLNNIILKGCLRTCYISSEYETINRRHYMVSLLNQRYLNLCNFSFHETNGVVYIKKDSKGNQNIKIHYFNPFMNSCETIIKNFNFDSKEVGRVYGSFTRRP